MKTIKYICILAVSTFIFNSCTKDVAGPTGPTGATGPQGPGNNYSYYVDSADVAPSSQWTQNGSVFQFTTGYISTLTNPFQDLVTVYVSTSLNSLGAEWYPIPCSGVLATSPTPDGFQDYYDTYHVTIQYIFGTAPAQKLYFKVVVVTN